MAMELEALELLSGGERCKVDDYYYVISAFSVQKCDKLGNFTM